MAEKPYQPQAVNYGQEPGKLNICCFGRSGRGMYRRSVFCLNISILPKSGAEKTTRKMPLFRYRGEKGAFYANRTEKAGKDHGDLV